MGLLRMDARVPVCPPQVDHRRAHAAGRRFRFTRRPQCSPGHTGAVPRETRTPVSPASREFTFSVFFSPAARETGDASRTYSSPRCQSRQLSRKGKNHDQTVPPFRSPYPDDPRGCCAHPVLHRTQAWRLGAGRQFRFARTGSSRPQHPGKETINQTKQPGPSRPGPTIMKYSSDKEIASLVRSLLALGWRYQTGGRHAKLTSPAGRRIAVPGTPGDHRASLNFRCRIRKLTSGHRT